MSNTCPDKYISTGMMMNNSQYHNSGSSMGGPMGGMMGGMNPLMSMMGGGQRLTYVPMQMPMPMQGGMQMGGPQMLPPCSCD
ncbi:hypothetical protein SNEBB_002295 [Seison nebaliae]|nr:hypothetical protein SNEBB_002295 [Seison nebaliae]